MARRTSAILFAAAVVIAMVAALCTSTLHVPEHWSKATLRRPSPRRAEALSQSDSAALSWVSREPPPIAPCPGVSARSSRCPAPRCYWHALAGPEQPSRRRCVASPWWPLPESRVPVAGSAQARAPIEDVRRSSSSSPVANDNGFSPRRGSRRRGTAGQNESVFEAATAHYFPLGRPSSPSSSSDGTAPQQQLPYVDDDDSADRRELRNRGVVAFRGACVSAAGGRLLHRRGRRPGRDELPDFGLEYGGFEEMNEFTTFVRGAEMATADSPNASMASSSRLLLLLPVAHPLDNPTHAMHRVAAALAFMRARRGNHSTTAARFDVALVVLEGHEPERLRRLNGYSMWTAALAASPDVRQWYAVAGGRSPSSSPSWLPKGPGRSARDERRCYRDVFALTLATRERGANLPLRPYPKTFRNAAVSYPMLGARRRDVDRATAALLRRTMAAAFEVAPDLRTAPRTDRPRLVILWRSLPSRRLSDFATLAPVLEAAWPGELRIVEHTHHRPAALARFFADADAVVGAMGSAFMWATMMPPGAVTVELVRTIGCAAGFPAGWGTAPECEFGGHAACLGLRHLTVHVPARCGVGGHAARAENATAAVDPSVHETSHHVPAAAWRAVFAAVVCALRGQTGERCPTVPLATFARCDASAPLDSE